MLIPNRIKDIQDTKKGLRSWLCFTFPGIYKTLKSNAQTGHVYDIQDTLEDSCAFAWIYRHLSLAEWALVKLSLQLGRPVNLHILKKIITRPYGSLGNTCTLSSDKTTQPFWKRRTERRKKTLGRSVKLREWLHFLLSVLDRTIPIILFFFSFRQTNPK